MSNPPLQSAASRRLPSSLLNPNLQINNNNSQPGDRSSRTPSLVPTLQSRESSGSDSIGSGGATSGALQHVKRSSSSQPLDAASFGVLTGAIGGSYSPFPRSSTYINLAPGTVPPPLNFRDSISSSDVAIDLSQAQQTIPVVPYRYSSSSNSEGSVTGTSPRELRPNLREGTNAALLWDKDNAEPDDYLHDPDPVLDRMLDKQWGHFSMRGFCNVAILAVVVGGLVGAFMGWPIWQSVNDKTVVTSGRATNLGYNLGGINASGQVPQISGLPHMIDASTPASAQSRIGFDGETYNLVFSDEFNVDGRTFWPGDDPWWEASDLHYWATKDYEWYDPDAVTTANGKLVITLSEEPNHNLSFRSGFLSSWNKLCFTGGYVEVSMSLPGDSKASGFWPAAWTMGNLARAGYGSTAYGVWPYSYDSCDVGTLPNQTMPDGVTPAAATQSGSTDYGGELSWLPGQKFSSCTCPGEDHPGPNVRTGRGAPEIDIIEGQVDYRGVGSASQSIQVAPIDAGYAWKNTTPYITIFNESKTFQNIWHGAVNQESLSVVTLLDDYSYEGVSYQSFGFEYDPGPAGRITWAVNGTPSWELTASAIGPNTPTEISQRLISEEPMAININLGISKAFQTPMWDSLVFPGHLYIDYIRVYQKGTPNVGCSPASHPTANYIVKHSDSYTNPNLTTWGQTGYPFPKNSMSGC